MTASLATCCIYASAAWYKSTGNFMLAFHHETDSCHKTVTLLQLQQLLAFPSSWPLSAHRWWYGVIQLHKDAGSVPFAAFHQDEAALQRQHSSCTCLAHHELESVFIIVMIITKMSVAGCRA